MERGGRDNLKGWMKRGRIPAGGGILHDLAGEPELGVGVEVNACRRLVDCLAERALAELHDEHGLLGIHRRSKELDHVRVMEPMHHLDLGAAARGNAVCGDLDHLDRHHFAAKDASVHRTKGAAADWIRHTHALLVHVPNLVLLDLPGVNLPRLQRPRGAGLGLGIAE